MSSKSAWYIVGTQFQFVKKEKKKILLSVSCVCPDFCVRICTLLWMSGAAPPGTRSWERSWAINTNESSVISMFLVDFSQSFSWSAFSYYDSYLNKKNRFGGLSGVTHSVRRLPAWGSFCCTKLPHERHLCISFYEKFFINDVIGFILSKVGSEQRKPLLVWCSEYYSSRE